MESEQLLLRYRGERSFHTTTVAEIPDVGVFIACMFELRNVHAEMFPKLVAMLAHSEREKEIIRTFIIETIKRWKEIEKLGRIFYGSEHWVIQDIFYLYEKVYHHDGEIVYTTRQVLLDETSLDLENDFEIHKFMMIGWMYADKCFGRFSESELTKISLLFRESYPWTWIDFLSRHNWDMMITCIKEMFQGKVGDFTTESKMQTRIFFWKDTKSKKQLREVYLETENIIGEFNRKYLLEALLS